MTSHTTEQALEAGIEKALTGTCKEERREGAVGEEECRNRFMGRMPAMRLGLPPNPCPSLRAGFDGSARCGLQ